MAGAERGGGKEGAGPKQEDRGWRQRLFVERAALLRVPEFFLDGGVLTVPAAWLASWTMAMISDAGSRGHWTVGDYAPPAIDSWCRMK